MLMAIAVAFLAPSALAMLTLLRCGARFVGSAHTRQGDGGKRVPGGHNGEAVSDPQSSTEARAGHGSAQNAD